MEPTDGMDRKNQTRVSYTMAIALVLLGLSLALFLQMCA